MDPSKGRSDNTVSLVSHDTLWQYLMCTPTVKYCSFSPGVYLYTGNHLLNSTQLNAPQRQAFQAPAQTFL